MLCLVLSSRKLVVWLLRNKISINKNKQIYFSLFFYIDILFHNQTTIFRILCGCLFLGLHLNIGQFKPFQHMCWQQTFGKYFVLWIHCDISFLLRTKNITLLVYAHTWLYRWPRKTVLLCRFTMILLHFSYLKKRGIRIFLLTLHECKVVGFRFSVFGILLHYYR